MDTAEESYKVHLPQFEGPFDLLLFFIERDELDIQAISLAKITNDFLDYINQLHQLNVEIASDFIFVAASLMRIKAKTLLPVISGNEKEIETVDEQDLVKRLIEYKLIKSNVEVLKSLEEKQYLKFKRGNSKESFINNDNSNGDEIANLTLYKLIKIYSNLNIKYIEKSEKPKHIVIQNPYSIAQQKEKILELLAINNLLSFEELKRNCKNRLEIVYNFLAILEMVQERLVKLQGGYKINNFFVQPDIV